MRERGKRRAAEDARKRAGEAVGCNGTRNLSLGRVALEADARDGAGIADGLGGANQEQQRHADDGARMELGQEGHEVRKRHNLQILEAAEVHTAHEQRHDIAEHQAEQNGELLQTALGEALEQKARKKRNGAQKQVLPGTEVGCAGAAGERLGAGGKQREANGDNHDGRHDAADVAVPVLGEQAQHALDAPADDDGADNCAHAVGGGNAA